MEGYAYLGRFALLFSLTPSGKEATAELHNLKTFKCGDINVVMFSDPQVSLTLLAAIRHLTSAASALSRYINYLVTAQSKCFIFMCLI